MMVLKDIIRLYYDITGLPIGIIHGPRNRISSSDPIPTLFPTHAHTSHAGHATGTVDPELAAENCKEQEQNRRGGSHSHVTSLTNGNGCRTVSPNDATNRRRHRLQPSDLITATRAPYPIFIVASAGSIAISTLVTHEVG